MKVFNYRSAVKDGSFISEYMKIMEAQETPYAYDFWCACWLLSLALGREIVIPRPRAPIYMNLYVLLIAESGVTRKSSAVRHASHIGREFTTNLAKRMDFIETKISPENLEQKLHILTAEEGQANIAIAISELVTFLGKERYTIAMPGLLTDLYDCPSTRIGGGTISRGKTIIKDVFVSFLAASTPTWLAKAINPDVIEGGFTSRCIFVVAENRKKRIAWPEGSSVDYSWFIDKLKEIRKKASKYKEIAITPNALKAFTNWYTQKQESRDPFCASYESREDAHVLRLAGFLAVDEDAWQIDAHHIRLAIKMIDQIKYDGSAIFVGGASADRLTSGLTVLRSKLVEAGIDGIRHNELYHQVRHYLKNDEYITALDIMHELQMVDCFIPKLPSAGRRSKIWRATKNITAPGTMAALQSRLIV